MRIKIVPVILPKVLTLAVFLMFFNFVQKKRVLVISCDTPHHLLVKISYLNPIKLACIYENQETYSIIFCVLVNDSIFNNSVMLPNKYFYLPLNLIPLLFYIIKAKNVSFLRQYCRLLFI